MYAREENHEAFGLTATVLRHEPMIKQDVILHWYRVTMIDQRHVEDDVLIEFKLYDGSFGAFQDRLDVEMISRGMPKGRWAWTQDYKTIGGVEEF